MIFFYVHHHGGIPLQDQAHPPKSKMADMSGMKTFLPVILVLANVLGKDFFSPALVLGLWFCSSYKLFLHILKKKKQ